MFSKERSQKVSIKSIAEDFVTDAAKVTAWLRAIYEDIFELNHEKPELFQQTGIKVSLSLGYLDNYCMFYTALLHFFFVKQNWVAGLFG